MKTAPDNTSLAIPPALLAEIQAEAEKEHRPAADVLRDVIEQGLQERRWRTHVESERQRAKDAGLPDDAIPLTDAYRQDLREKIAAGMRSLRQGKGTDGEAFMAQMDAELAALEQQGR